MSFSWAPAIKKWADLRGVNETFSSDPSLSRSLTVRGDSAQLKDLSDYMEKEDPSFDERKLVEVSSPWMKISGIKSGLQRVRSNFLKTSKIRIVAATWNVAGDPPNDDMNLDDWLLKDELLSSNSPDIYVICLQETVPLTANALLATDPEDSGRQWDDKIRSYLNLESPDTPQPNPLKTPEPLPETTPDSSEAPVTPTKQTLEATAKSDSEQDVAAANEDAARDDGEYSLVASKQMVGIHLAVFVHDRILDKVGNVKVSCVALGIFGLLGNKGSIAISLSVGESFFCFIGSHLSAGQKEADLVKRRADLVDTVNKVKFSSQEESDRESRRIRNLPATVEEHDHVVWLGDFNFRLDMDEDKVWGHLAAKDWPTLLEADQLSKEMAQGGALHGWTEPAITFPPTYKYVPMTGQYVGQEAGPDGEEKRRTPAWCDRVILRAPQADAATSALSVVRYGRGECQQSDHRPVSALLQSATQHWTAGAWRQALTLVRSEMDRQEYTSRPMGRLDPHTADFGELKYGEAVSLSVSLENTGAVPMHFKVKVPEAEGRVPSWLRFSPSQGTVEQGKAARLQVEACVVASAMDLSSAVVAAGQESSASYDWLFVSSSLFPRVDLSQFLIVEVEDRGDLFLSVSAKYKPSIWGLSLDALSQLSPANDDLPPVPTELRRMLKFLSSNVEELQVPASIFEPASAGIVTGSPGPLGPLGALGLEALGDAWGGLLGVSVSWKSSELELLGRTQPVREALDSGTEFPEGTTSSLVGTTLVTYLRALPEPVVSAEVANKIDSLAVSPSQAGKVFGDLVGWRGAVLGSLLETFCAVLKSQIGNEFLLRDIASVFSTALFPQGNCELPVRSFQRRCAFLRRWTKIAMEYLD